MYTEHIDSQTKAHDLNMKNCSSSKYQRLFGTGCVQRTIVSKCRYDLHLCIFRCHAYTFFDIPDFVVKPV